MNLAKNLVKLGLSVSSTCKLLSIPRSSFYFYLKPISSKNSALNSKLANLIQNIAFSFPSFGYRRITAILKQMGYKINHKRVYRIYKQLNLQKSPPKGYKNKQKRPAFKILTPSATNDLWSLDIIEDVISKNGSVKKFRIFNLIDVFSRFAFPPLINTSLTGEKIAEHLKKLIESYGCPRAIIRDDGPEFRSKSFQKIISKYRIKEVIIPPGQPFKNGYVESFHSRMREELLDAEVFESLEEARTKVLNWVKWYNTERPHSGIRYKPPIEVFKKGGQLDIIKLKCKIISVQKWGHIQNFRALLAEI